ncbi:MAG: GWxTD domain-containing protein [Candidatus Edwardsbacteria bacterium]
MRRKYKLIWQPLRLNILFLLLFIIQPSFAGKQTSPTITIEGRKEIKFSLQTAEFLGEKKGEIKEQISYQIPYNQLQFIREKEKYQARFELLAIVYDEKGNQVTGDVWQRELSADSYEETLKKEKGVEGQVTLWLKPGKYQLIVQINDLNSQRQGQWKKEIVISQIDAEPLSLSALEFNKSDRRYNEDFSKVKLIYEIYDFNPEVSQGETLQISQEVKRTEDGEIIISQKFPLSVSSLRTQGTMEFTVDSLSSGAYTVEVKVESKKNRINRAEEFYVETSFFFLEKEYNKRVEQLIYIATSEEMKKLKEAAPEERKKLWDEFWQSKNPTPALKRNEAMIDYFRRVDYANEHFSTYRKENGWKTDRGRIYIRYGPPDEVERHPFELDTRPYEIWYYYQTNQKFVFMDIHGFGEYILVYPKTER